MKIKDFKKLVKDIVKQEMITQKEQILTEIKAQLFDFMSAIMYAFISSTLS